MKKLNVAHNSIMSLRLTALFALALSACDQSAFVTGAGRASPEDITKAAAKKNDDSVDPGASPSDGKTPETLAKAYDVIVYVAANGNDGLTLQQINEQNPIKSITKVNDLLKNNTKVSIAVLFRRGDTWNANDTSNTTPDLYINRGNVLIGAYGTGTEYPKFCMTGAGISDRGVINMSNADQVVLKGLYVYSENPVKAFRIGINVSGGKSTRLEFNDVVVNGFYHNIAVGGSYTNGVHTYDEVILSGVKILNGRTTELPFVNNQRTGVVLGDYSSSSGIYIVDVKTVKVSNSLFANNGNQVTANNDRPHYSFYNHQIYFGAGTSPIENVIIQGSSFMTTYPKLPGWYENGVEIIKDFTAQASPWLEGPDGLKTPVQSLTVQNNLFYGLQGILFARKNTVTIEDNVIFGTRALSKCTASSDNSVCFNKWGGGTTGPLSGGMQVGGDDMLVNASLRRNLCTHRTMTNASGCFSIIKLLDPDYTTKPNVEGNVIYDWNGQISIDSGTTGISMANFALKNSYTPQGGANPGFKDPSRSFATYAPGGNSDVEYVRKVISQGQGVWDSALTPNAMNNYMRDGYGMTAK